MTEDLEIVDDDDPDDDEDDAEGTPVMAGFDLGGLLAQAESMQRQLVDARIRAAETLVEGQAGGGVVRIRMTADFNPREVLIDPEVVDPHDVEMLQDLILAALRDALTKVEEVNAESVGGIGDAFGGLGP